MDIQTQFKISESTPFYADTVEWCPVDDLNHILACGTYQLDENSSIAKDQFRDGNIVFYELSSEQSAGCSSYNLSNFASISTNGVLDLKWCPHKLNSKAVLGAARSDGKISLHEVCCEEHKLSVLTSYSIKESYKMFLSLDWYPNNMSIIASDTTGNLNYLQMKESDLCAVEIWKGHDFECWVSAFDYSNPNTIFSGGDDCYFKRWDLRNTLSPTNVNTKHSMGVTSISKSKLNENFLVTGSYDENIFLWDVRNLKNCLSELNLGGGIWRLKWHPSNPHLLLCAAMHNGFHIVSISENDLLLKFSFMEHQSLAYGVDWGYNIVKGPCCSQHNVKNIVASCSFYDKNLCVWGINL